MTSVGPPVVEMATMIIQPVHHHLYKRVAIDNNSSSSSQSLLIYNSNTSAANNQSLAAGLDLSEEAELKRLNFPAKSEDLSTAIPLTIIFALLLVTGCIGNICTAIVIVRPKNRYMHTATNYYLFSLAMSDLIFLILGLPQEMYTLWQRYPYIFGETFCIVRGYISEVATLASILIISAFTVERYVAICHPLWAHTLSQLPRCIAIIVTIWIVAFFCAIPPAISLGVVYQRGPISDRVLEETAQCAQKQIVFENMFEFSAIVFFIIPMIIVTVLYVLIAIELRKSSSMNSGQHSSTFRQSKSSLQATNNNNNNNNNNTGVVERASSTIIYSPTASSSSNNYHHRAATPVAANRCSVCHSMSCSSARLLSGAENDDHINKQTGNNNATQQQTGRTLNIYYPVRLQKGNLITSSCNILKNFTLIKSGRPSCCCCCYCQDTTAQQHQQARPIDAVPMLHHPSIVNISLQSPSTSPISSSSSPVSSCSGASPAQPTAAPSTPDSNNITTDNLSGQLTLTTNTNNNGLDQSLATSNNRQELDQSKVKKSESLSAIPNHDDAKFVLDKNNTTSLILDNNKQVDTGKRLHHHHHHRATDHQPDEQQQQMKRSASHSAGQQLQHHVDHGHNYQLHNNNNNHHRCKHSQQSQLSNQLVNRRTAAASSKKSVIRMLVAVVVSFFICWSPFHAQRLLASYLTKSSSQSQFLMDAYLKLTYISGIMYYLSSTVNPILYQLMSAKFRLAFKETFNCSLFQCLSLNNKTTTTTAAATTTIGSANGLSTPTITPARAFVLKSETNADRHRKHTADNCFSKQQQAITAATCCKCASDIKTIKSDHCENLHHHHHHYNRVHSLLGTKLWSNQQHQNHLSDHQQQQIKSKAIIITDSDDQLRGQSPFCHHSFVNHHHSTTTTTTESNQQKLLFENNKYHHHQSTTNNNYNIVSRWSRQFTRSLSTLFNKNKNSFNNRTSLMKPSNSCCQGNDDACPLSQPLMNHRSLVGLASGGHLIKNNNHNDATIKCCLSLQNTTTTTTATTTNHNNNNRSDLHVNRQHSFASNYPPNLEDKPTNNPEAAAATIEEKDNIDTVTSETTVNHTTIDDKEAEIKVNYLKGF